MINVVDVVDPAEIKDPFALGLLLPVPGTEKNTILTEARDGEHIQRLTAVAVEFRTGAQVAFRDRKIKIDVLITDARITLACSKYDKGGGWIGGASFMVVANSVSKARAKLRSRGKMLVGQVRYPWIQRVGSSPRTGWASEEKLVLDTKAGQGGQMRLTLTLPKSLDSASVASEIARRAAAYRLASEELAPDTRSRLGQVPNSEPTESDGVRFFTFPEPRWVTEESARLMPRAGATKTVALSEKSEPITRRCPVCGALNRLPGDPARMVRCGRCQREFAS